MALTVGLPRRKVSCSTGRREMQPADGLLPALSRSGRGKGGRPARWRKVSWTRAGGGIVYAIDPHEVRPDIADQAEDRLPVLQANLDAAKVSAAVEVVQARSHDARPQFSEGSVDVLF